MQSALVSSPVVVRPRFSVAQLPTAGRASRSSVVTQAAAIAAEDVPDMGKRVSMIAQSCSGPADDRAGCRQPRLPVVDVCMRASWPSG